MYVGILKYFLAVVREENITKAAEVLHVTQPTLSRQLSKMEDDLGVQRLFTSFKERYPRVQFDLYTGNADQIKQRLDNGLTDIGILLEPVEIEKYDFIRFNILEHWVVLMRPDAPLVEKDSVTIKDLVKLPLSPERTTTSVLA